MSRLDVKMPRLGVNDEYVTLAEWVVENGKRVSEGDTIAIIETTKETSEINAESEGFLFHKYENGAEVKVDEIVAVITETEQFEFDDNKKDTSNTKITEKARALVEKYNIDVTELSHINIIREKDILPLINNGCNIERNKSNDIIIVGGGGLAKMCIDLIRLNKAYNIHGITDPELSIGTDVMGVPYLGTDDVLGSLRKEGFMTAVNAAGGIAIDNNSNDFNLRRRLYEDIKEQGFFMPTLIHPSAEIAPSAQIGEGTFVFEKAVIGSEAMIGDDCIINTGAIVSHDCKICNHTRISPGAILAGDVTVGENSLIGMGVTIYIGARIGKNVIIANGQNIVGDVPDNTIVK